MREIVGLSVVAGMLMVKAATWSRSSFLTTRSALIEADFRTQSERNLNRARAYNARAPALRCGTQVK
jgi:hypothetical protein